MRVGDKIDLDALKADREQLWAEAVALYKDGHQIWLANDDPVYKLAQEEQAARIVADPWEDPISEYMKGKMSVTVAEILDHALQIKAAQQDKATSNRVCAILRGNGWNNDSFEMKSGKRCRVWKKKADAQT